MRWTVVIAALLVLGGAGCGGVSCKAYAASALLVHVLDPTGQPICDANVVARDGQFSQTLQRLPGAESTSCSYAGPYERPGSYTVEASRNGLTATSEKVTVSRDACHVIGKQLTLTLGK